MMEEIPIKIKSPVLIAAAQALLGRALEVRYREMKDLKEQGMTLEEIGKLYNPPLTKERVRQILKDGDEKKESV